MFSRLFRRSTVSTLCYGILVLITTFFVAISCAFLLSQAARTAPNRGFIKNINAVVIGAAYVLVVVLSVSVCIKRRIAIFRRLQRIHKGSATRGVGEAPKVRTFDGDRRVQTADLISSKLWTS